MLVMGFETVLQTVNCVANCVANVLPDYRLPMLCNVDWPMAPNLGEGLPGLYFCQHVGCHV